MVQYVSFLTIGAIWLKPVLLSSDTSLVIGVLLVCSPTACLAFAAAAMPPKGKAAPKPVEFSVSPALAGRRRWVAGSSGPSVQLNVDANPLSGSVNRAPVSQSSEAQRPREDGILLGKVIFGAGVLCV